MQGVSFMSGDITVTVTCVSCGVVFPCTIEEMPMMYAEDAEPEQLTVIIRYCPKCKTPNKIKIKL